MAYLEGDAGALGQPHQGIVRIQKISAMETNRNKITDRISFSDITTMLHYLKTLRQEVLG
jgi:hypothetical protein